MVPQIAAIAASLLKIGGGKLMRSVALSLCCLLLISGVVWAQATAIAFRPMIFPPPVAAQQHYKYVAVRPSNALEPQPELDILTAGNWPGPTSRI